MGAEQAGLCADAEKGQEEDEELQVGADAPPRQQPPSPCPPPRARPARGQVLRQGAQDASPEGGAIFEKLVEELMKPEKRERPENSWVRPSTCLLVDQRAAMQKEGTSDQRKIWRLTR